MHSDVSTKVKKNISLSTFLSATACDDVARLIDLCERRSAEEDAKQPWARLGAVHV